MQNYSRIDICYRVRILSSRSLRCTFAGSRLYCLHPVLFFLNQFLVTKMEFSSSIGGIAAILTTVSFVPQVWRVVRTRDTNAISLMMYLMFSAGVTLWLIYGVMLGLWPVIISNAVTLVLSLMVIFFKVRGTARTLHA